jgi:hypothetical protein
MTPAAASGDIPERLAVVTTAALTGLVELRDEGSSARPTCATGATTAISINVYGTDVTRVGSSVRRYYH